MMTPNQERARRIYRTTEVRGDGGVVRISRCLPVPVVVLFPTLDAAEQAAAKGKKCSEWGCRGLHATEYLDDERVPDLFPWSD